MSEPRTPAATRGTLTVADSALASLARITADHVDGVLPGSGLLGREKTADVSVHRAGRRVWLSVDVTAPWPCRVAEIGGRVRDEVIARTEGSTGAALDRVDVTVHLTSPQDERSIA